MGLHPDPSDLNAPRYSARPFPPYRYLPGRHPHPRRNPQGHSYGQPEPRPRAFPPDDWRQAELYLYGADLYNFGYWWESHEAFEGLWHAMGHTTQPGRFFQGLIQVAAANLKYRMGAVQPADRLWRRGIETLSAMPPRYMGLAVPVFTQEVRDYFAGRRVRPALIRLTDDR